jgi:hypothetical protein
MTLTAERARELLEVDRYGVLCWRWTRNGHISRHKEVAPKRRQVKLDGTAYSKRKIAHLLTMPDGTTYSAVPNPKRNRPKHNRSKYGSVKPWKALNLTYQNWRYRLAKGTITLQPGTPAPTITAVTEESNDA